MEIFKGGDTKLGDAVLSQTRDWSVQEGCDLPQVEQLARDTQSRLREAPRSQALVLALLLLSLHAALNKPTCFLGL